MLAEKSVEPGKIDKDISENLKLRREYVTVIQEAVVLPLAYISRFSSLWSLIRSTSWILRFVNKWRKSAVSGRDVLAAEEFKAQSR